MLLGGLLEQLKLSFFDIETGWGGEIDMKKVQVYQVDAFTSEAFGGNAAGVVPNADGLSEIEMQKIARELNQSETAFVLKTDREDADVKIRYFTPSSEIDFCGHATVGLSWVLATEYGWKDNASEIRLETNIGVVPVKWTQGDGKVESVVMTQVAPKLKEINVDASIISRLVGVAADDIDNRYPIKLAYTGNWHLLVPIKTKHAVDGALPLLDELAAFNREYQASTTHLFTFDSDTNATLYTRDFAPAVGIPEDPVTGSANGALAGYLALEKIIEAVNYKIDQGHSVGRPGSLEITVHYEEGNPIISVGGQAVTVFSGILSF
jgi:trans-2,3-dihydro-3-hydroxyanthranilate isomerase